MGKRSLAVPFTFVALLTLAPKFSGAEGATSKIAFAADVGGAGDIFVVNSDGTGLANVTNSPISEGGPVWSPDGGSIACSSENGIWTMNADGSNAVNLINGGTANASPSWSPDGTKISFFSTRDHGWSDIFVMERDGSDPINLTPTEGHGGNSPAWSPDGQSIAFHGFAEIVDIFVMASDGSDLRNLTNNTARDSRPEWSPDGNLIAFHSTRDGGDCGSNLFVMNADGSQVRQLTTSPHCGSAPSWSPDGSRIVFTSTRMGECQQVFVMNADGSQVQPLTTLPDCGSAPSWSPDGSQIVFTKTTVEGNDLHIIDVDGTHQRPLTALGAASHFGGTAWSPLMVITAVFERSWGGVKFDQTQR